MRSFSGYGILWAGKQMTSRSLSYTANAGSFDTPAFFAHTVSDGTIYVRGLWPGSYAGFFVMGKEAFLFAAIYLEVSVYVQSNIYCRNI